MLTAAVCDDDPAVLARAEEILRRQLAAVPHEIRTYPSADAMLEEIRTEAFVPQIAVLDIQMPGESGIGAARLLNEKLPACRVIFLTDYVAYVSSVYETRHSYFVLKGEMEEHLPKAAEKAVRELRDRTVLHFRAEGEWVAVPAEELLYMERQLRKTRVVTDSGEYLTYSAPSGLLDGNAAEPVVRCHSSYWVNLSRVRSMSAESFLLTGGESVPISRRYKAAARSAFFAFLHEGLASAGGESRGRSYGLKEKT